MASFRLAREHFLTGDYEEAATLYEELTKKPANTVRAACGRSEIDRLLGDYEDGISRLTAIERRGRASADWHACLAALLVEVGRYDEAIEHNRRAVAIDEQHFRAHWQLGQIYETLGRAQDAVRAYQIFDDVMIGDDLPGQLPTLAEDLTYLGQGFLRYSILTRNTNVVRRTRHVLQEVYQDAFDHVDALYWPARLATAELLLEKHSLSEAKGDFELICEQNPRVPDAHVGLGGIALEHWDFEEAEKQAEAALAINPRHVAARVLLADTRMAERRYEDAATVARQALDTNANSIDALSVLAAALLRAGDGLASQETQNRVARINPRPAVLHYVLGAWLSAGRQFADAERHLKRAVEYAPSWPEPRTELGLLYMETGEEAPARKTLEASFKLDGFNNRTFYVLELLDSLESFGRLQTDHFIIKYDEQEDGIVAPYFAEALEEMYGEVCSAYDMEPEKRTIIELFPDHMGFSVRITARPFIATVGACTGRVIALAAPRRESPFGGYNWRTVLRHEFTHTVTLAATENRIPHWMTEGLAVSQEPAPRSWGAKQMLSNAVWRDRLFTLESIDWGFIRPRRPDDRGLAYAQSEWMIEYIVERYQHKAVLDLLRAFHDGLPQADAFARVLKTDTDAFDRHFKTWAARQVEEWGLPVVPVEDVDEITAKLKDDPNNTDLLLRLARAELLKGELDNADETVRQVLKQNKNDTGALEVIGHVLIARMLIETDQSKRREFIDQAEPYVQRLHELEPENATAIKYLGYVEQSREHWGEAIRYLSRYQARFADDPDPYRRLAAIHLRRKDVAGALRQLEPLFRLVDDEPAVACQIASLHLDIGQPDQAARWFRRAIEIDPYDAETHARLAAAYLEAKQYAAAEREYLVVSKLLPKESIGYDGLSRVYSAMGDVDKAAAYQKEAEAIREKMKDEGRRMKEEVPRSDSTETSTPGG
ncbi:MAG: tetratricopeptide repeat protein [Phycisphaerae bacterium]|nr:tetratricopeptide repeat protein [Phycisphaerae bacterium]